MSLAKFLGIGDTQQVRNRGPGTFPDTAELFKGPDRVFPCRRRGILQDLLDCLDSRSRSLEDVANGRFDVLGSDPVKWR